MGDKSKAKNIRDAAIKKQTYITYNLGGSWRLIKAPSINYDGDRVNCDIDDGCSLHFAANPPIYHSSKAAGIIIGYGNYGTEMINDYDLPATFVSRDGGYTWKMMSKYMLDIVSGDHGGLLFGINDTDAIYSWNEGKTWKTIDYSPYLSYTSKAGKEAHSHIYKIETTPEEISLRFLAFSYNDEQEKLVLISSNFEGYQEPRCTGSNIAD